MALEELGVKIDVSNTFQEKAVADAKTIGESSLQFRKVLNDHELGNVSNLSSTILTKIEGLGVDLNTQNREPGFNTPFLQQVREVVTSTVLREIKYSARIPILGSYLLVGVADEGPPYFGIDLSEMYILPERHIYGMSQHQNL
jgi:RNA-dependent RNA polymerase